MSTCQNCQNEVAEGAKFCPACGTPVQAAPESPAGPASGSSPYGAEAPAFGSPPFGMPGDSYPSSAPASGSHGSQGSGWQGSGPDAAGHSPAGHAQSAGYQAQPNQPQQPFAPQQPQQAPAQAAQQGQFPPIPPQGGAPGGYGQQTPPGYGQQQSQQPAHGQQQGDGQQPAYSGQNQPGAYGQPGTPADPAASGGMNTTVSASSWPIPDQPVDVLGKRVPLDIAIVAGLGALATIFWVIANIEAITHIGDMFSGLFDPSPMGFGFGWAIAYLLLIMIAVLALLVIGTMKVLAADRVGRGLLTAATVLLVAFMTTGGTGAWHILATLLSIVAVVILWVSPNVKKAFVENGQGSDVPESIGTSRLVMLMVFGAFAVLALLYLIGLRHIGSGEAAKYIFSLLFLIVGAVAGILGWRALNAKPDKQGRIFASVGALCFFVAMAIILSNDMGGTNLVVPLALAAVPVVPLWVTNGARAWFGDKPMVSKAQ